jgi:PAS domain S-box-containing protein
MSAEVEAGIGTKDAQAIPVQSGVRHPTQARDLLDLLERAQMALGESEERFRLMADTAPLMIWMSGPDKRCTYFNKSWLDFTGRPLDRELGQGWSEAVHPDDVERCLNAYVNAFDARQGFQMEYRLRRFDGEYRWLRDTGVPRFGSDGNFAGYIGSCIDVTEWKRAETDADQLRRDVAHLTRVATLGELTASLAHELSQPLTAILANAQAAERLLAAGPQTESASSPDLEQVREILHDIAVDDKRAVELIHRLRGLLKKEDLERKPVDLNEVVHEAVELVAHHAAMRQVALALELEPDLPHVTGDPVQLQQVVLNFFLNGLDAMRDLAPEDRKLLVRTHKKDAHAVELAVRDSGTGVPPDRLARIFEPFYTTKPSGLGLGLSISRSIIEAHGGRVEAANNPDSGATIAFSLPAEQHHDRTASDDLPRGR